MFDPFTPSGAITVGDSTSGTAMYEPNQFCMNCGMVDDNAGPIRFSSPIGRNLNDGDSIILLVRPNTTQATSIQGTVRYAITLQGSSHYTSNFNCIKICGARRCSIPSHRQGRVILSPPLPNRKLWKVIQWSKNIYNEYGPVIQEYI